MRSRHFQRVGLTLGAVLAAVLFFMGGAALRLLMGPISLGPFSGAIEDAVNRSLTGLVVRFDQAALEWSRADGQINLVILGTNVFDATGRIVAQAPKSDLDFDAASLLSGEFALKRFALLGVQLTAVRDTEGTLKLGFGPAQGDVDLLEVIRKTLEGGESGPGSLETFSIQDARLAFRDDITGLFVISPDVSFTVENRDGAFTATLDAEVEISGAPAQLDAVATLDTNGMPQNGTVSIEGLDFAALAANSEKFAALAPYALKANVSSNYRLGEDGQIADASLTFAAAGQISPPGMDKTYQVDALEIEGAYVGIDHRVVFDRAHISGPNGNADASGVVDFVWGEAGLVSLAVDLAAENVLLDEPDLFADPFALDSLIVSAAFDAATREVAVEQLRLAGNGLDAEFEGTTAFPEGMTPAISVTGTIAKLSVADALRVWPLIVGRGARNWIADNVSEGMMGPLGIAADIPAGIIGAGPLPQEALTLTFPVEGVAANYMRGLTPVTELNGEGTLTGNTFQMTVVDAKIGPLLVTGGTMIIPDLHIPQPPGNIKASVTGSMVDVLTLIDMEPLGYPTRFRVRPQDVSGTAMVDLDVSLPMRRNLAIEEVRIAVTTQVEGLGLPIQATRMLSGANATIMVDNDHLTAEGTGALNDVPMQFAWEEVFAGEDEITTRVDVSGTLDEEARGRLRLTTPEWLSGPVEVSANFTGRRFDFREAEVTADLSAVSIDLEAINLVKESGAPMTGTGTVAFLEGGAAHIGNMRVTGGDISLTGELDLDATGRLVAASLPSVRYGEVGDLSILLDAAPGMAPSWRIAGRSLDASRIFADDEEAEPPAEVAAEERKPLAPITLIADMDSVLLREGVTLRDVAFRLGISEGERLTDFYIDAQGPGDGIIEGRFVRGETRGITLHSDNAGEFVEAFTGFQSLHDGEIDIEASFRPDTEALSTVPGPDYSGTIRITNFTVVDQPFVARLFSIGSLDGPLRLLQGDGIPFSELEAPFVAHGGNVALRDGTASGMAMGLSFQGVIDRDNDTMDVNGSLVPLFGLNNMLGALPIVGDILVSKEGEGIIGLTYAARGDLDEPQVMVNPLSVLTPGIFRRMFEFGGPPPE